MQLTLPLVLGRAYPGPIPTTAVLFSRDPCPCLSLAFHCLSVTPAPAFPWLRTDCVRILCDFLRGAGNNPVVVAVPRAGGEHVLLDMATSQVRLSRIRPFAWVSHCLSSPKTLPFLVVLLDTAAVPCSSRTASSRSCARKGPNSRCPVASIPMVEALQRACHRLSLTFSRLTTAFSLPYHCLSLGTFSGLHCRSELLALRL